MKNSAIQAGRTSGWLLLVHRKLTHFKIAVTRWIHATLRGSNVSTRTHATPKRLVGHFRQLSCIILTKAWTDLLDMITATFEAVSAVKVTKRRNARTQTLMSAVKVTKRRNARTLTLMSAVKVPKRRNARCVSMRVGTWRLLLLNARP
jgi:hypothetical protein